MHDVYPSALECGCLYYDEKGFEVYEGTRFYARHPSADFRNRLLKVDYVTGKGIVKYVDPMNEDFCDDNGPVLYITNVVTVASLRSLLFGLRMFQKHTLTRLKQLRQRQSLATCLTFKWLRRFQACSRGLRRAFAQVTPDKAWVQACQLQWVAVTKRFTKQHMLRHDPAWVDTVCYLAKGDLVLCCKRQPVQEESVGWLWVAFRTPYGLTACREGWIHPDIIVKLL